MKYVIYVDGRLMAGGHGMTFELTSSHYNGNEVFIDVPATRALGDKTVDILAYTDDGLFKGQFYWGPALNLNAKVSTSRGGQKAGKYLRYPTNQVHEDGH